MLNNPALPRAVQASLSQPEPRLIHAIILLVTCGLTVLVTAVLGPSLPAMQRISPMCRVPTFSCR